MKNAIINLQSGIEIDLLNPTEDDIRIEDIARGLAYKSHFGGHTPKYFSIAEHSLLVSYVTNDLVGLLHDASEAYIGDMLRPIKKHMDVFVEVENKLMKVIYEKYGLKYEDLHSYDLKRADDSVLYHEWEHFFPITCETHNFNPFFRDDILDVKRPIYYYEPDYVYKLFLIRFNELCSNTQK